MLSAQLKSANEDRWNQHTLHVEVEPPYATTGRISSIARWDPLSHQWAPNTSPKANRCERLPVKHVEGGAPIATMYQDLICEFKEIDAGSHVAETIRGSNNGIASVAVKLDDHGTTD